MRAEKGEIPRGRRETTHESVSVREAREQRVKEDADRKARAEREATLAAERAKSFIETRTAEQIEARRKMEERAAQYAKQDVKRRQTIAAYMNNSAAFELQEAARMAREKAEEEAVENARLAKEKAEKEAAEKEKERLNVRRQSLMEKSPLAELPERHAMSASDDTGTYE